MNVKNDFEIRLRDVVYYLLSCWKSLLLAILLALACIFGYSYKNYKDAKVVAKESTGEIGEAFSEEELKELNNIAETIDFYKQGISSQEKFISDVYSRNYDFGSVYKYTYTYTVSLQEANEADLKLLLYSYSDSLKSNNLYDLVSEKWNVNNTFVSRIIDVSTYVPSVSENESNVIDSGLLKIWVFAANQEDGQTIKGICESFIKEESENLSQSIAEHTIDLSDSNLSVGESSDLWSDMVSAFKAIESEESTIEEMYEELDDSQIEYINKYIAEEESEVNRVKEAKFNISKKKAAIVLIGFVGLWALYHLISYVYGSKFKNPYLAQDKYGVETLFTAEKLNKLKTSRFKNRHIYNLEESKEMLDAKLSLSLNKGDSVLLAGENKEEIASYLKEKGYQVIEANDVVYDASSINSLKGIKAAVILLNKDSNNIAFEEASKLLKDKETIVLMNI